MDINYSPIGTIHTTNKTLSGMPIQPAGAIENAGHILLEEKYTTALKDLEKFSHLILIYHLHRQDGWKPVVTPFMDNIEHGVFATRAPSRPNAIGLSVVALESIQRNKITFYGADMLDGTPLLDIKPYVPKFDEKEDVRTGWLEKNADRVQKTKSDGRFQ